MADPACIIRAWLVGPPPSRTSVWSSAPPSVVAALESLQAERDKLARTLQLADEDHEITEAHNRERAVAAEQEAATLREAPKRLYVALEELLDVAKRIRGGDPSLDPEMWYAARDYAQVVLDDYATVASVSTPETPQ